MVFKIKEENMERILSILKTTEEIYSDYWGRDNAEQIKYFIKDALEQWNVTYVLLVGSIDLLPIRTAAVQWYGPDNETLVVEDIITDLYYADIYDENDSFCSWDSNENDIFGKAIYFAIIT